jgi:hypothetical protein
MPFVLQLDSGLLEDSKRSTMRMPPWGRPLAIS